MKKKLYLVLTFVLFLAMNITTISASNYFNRTATSSIQWLDNTNDVRTIATVISGNATASVAACNAGWNDIVGEKYAEAILWKPGSSCHYHAPYY